MLSFAAETWVCILIWHTVYFLSSLGMRSAVVKFCHIGKNCVTFLGCRTGPMDFSGNWQLTLMSTLVLRSTKWQMVYTFAKSLSLLSSDSNFRAAVTGSFHSKGTLKANNEVASHYLITQIETKSEVCCVLGDMRFIQYCYCSTGCLWELAGWLRRREDHRFNFIADSGEGINK